MAQDDDHRRLAAQIWWLERERREVSMKGIVRGMYTMVAVTGLKWAPGPVNL